MSAPMTDGERLVRVETIVEGLDKKVDKIIDDHEGRIRALEKLVWRASGGAAVLGASVGYVASLVFGV